MLDGQKWSFWVNGIYHSVVFDDLLLLEVRRVSEGSYQPVLAFIDELDDFHALQQLVYYHEILPSELRSLEYIATGSSGTMLHTVT